MAWTTTLVNRTVMLGKRFLTVAGLSLREMIHEFKWQTLVLFKAALLQPKVDSLSLFKVATLTSLDRCCSLALTASVSA